MSSVWCLASRRRRVVGVTGGRPAVARTALISRTIARSRRLAAASCATGGGVATGMKRPSGRKRKSARLAAEEARQGSHQFPVLEPRPVPGLREELRRGIRERVGIGLGEARRDVRVALAPDNERGARDPAQLLPRASERVLRCAAVEPQHGALRALVEAVGDEPRPRLQIRREHSQRARGRRAHEQLAQAARSPDPRDAMPAIARQERHRVDDHEPLDALGRPHREQEPGRTPVVDDHAHALQAARVRERLHEAPEPLHRVVEVAALAAAPEPRQVRCEATGLLQELQPVVPVRRHPVEVQDGIPRSLLPEDLGVADGTGVLADLGHAAPEDSVAGMRTLCLGEALVDLVCEHALDSPELADAFVPRFGGDVANAAVTAARCGADIALAGGAGEDAWGIWLRDRLAAEGVALDWFGLLAGVQTPIAFVTVDGHGEPTFVFYGDVVAPAVRAVGARLPEAVTSSDALFLTSNTLLGEQERMLALTARRQAIDEGKPVVLDANLRPARWASADAAVATVQGCVPSAALLKCNRAEAQVLTAATTPPPQPKCCSSWARALSS